LGNPHEQFPIALSGGSKPSAAARGAANLAPALPMVFVCTAGILFAEEVTALVSGFFLFHYPEKCNTSVKFLRWICGFSEADVHGILPEID
jgi:hypothetical protein